MLMHIMRVNGVQNNIIHFSVLQNKDNLTELYFLRVNYVKKKKTCLYAVVTCLYRGCWCHRGIVVLEGPESGSQTSASLTETLGLVPLGPACT